MKNRKMLDIMGFADEKYVSEADPTNQKSVAKSKFRWITVLSAAACFLLILNIAIVVPLLANKDEPSGTGSSLNHIQGGGIIQNQNSHIQNPDVNDGGEDGGEEYIPDMQFLKNPQLLGALDKYFDKDYAEGKDEIMGDLSDKLESEDSVQESARPNGGTLEDALEKDDQGSLSPDLNDNQVQGVSEADIAKRSDSHLFYLRGTTLYVYSINGGASKAECVLPLDGYLAEIEALANELRALSSSDKFDELYDNALQWEMYLSADFKTITIIATTDSYLPCATGMVILDVSKAPTVEFKDFKIFAGEYVTSRVVGDEILLFTKYSVPMGYNKENPMAYVPFYVQSGETRYTNDIYFPSELSGNAYITVTRLSQKKLRVLESVSYLSYSDNIYVSKENVYLTREIPLLGISGTNDFILDETDPDNDYRRFEPIDTEIAVIGYKSALFQNRGTATVKGYVHNQYNLDEHKGILRVATTSYVKNERGGYDSSASLWCIDISTMKIAASVENFAPLGDVVRSTRFDGTMAYVCTSLQELIFSDPVFFFDLSDLNNITYTDTGIIDGYSSSLINIGGGYLVGIGYGNGSSTLKIEVYKEENDKVVTVCVEEFSSTRFSTDYKSYYVDRTNHLLGLAISTYSADTKKYEDSYLLLHFDGEYFDKVMALDITHVWESSARAFYEKNYLYVVTDKEFNAFDVGRLNGLPFVSTDGSTTGTSQAPSSTPSGPNWP